MLDNACERRWIQLRCVSAGKDKERLSYEVFYMDMQYLLKQLREQDTVPKWFVKSSRPQKNQYFTLLLNTCRTHNSPWQRSCLGLPFRPITLFAISISQVLVVSIWQVLWMWHKSLPALHGQQSFGKSSPSRQEHFLGQAEATAHCQDDAAHLGWFSRNLWNKAKELWCWWGSGETKVQNSSLPHWDTAQGI